MSSKTCPHCGGNAPETSSSHHTTQHGTQHSLHAMMHGYPWMGLIALIFAQLRKLGVGVEYCCSKCGKTC